MASVSSLAYSALRGWAKPGFINKIIMNISKNIKYLINLTFALSFLLLFGLACSILMSAPKVVGASGETISPYNSFTTSGGVLVLSSTSTNLVATNTARLFLQVTNIGTSTIYCNLTNGAWATKYVGLTLFASSTYRFLVDENPYTGPVNCIADGANASTTILEK